MPKTFSQPARSVNLLPQYCGTLSLSLSLSLLLMLILRLRHNLQDRSVNLQDRSISYLGTVAPSHSHYKHECESERERESAIVQR